jgi:hypothetical protein
MDHEIDANIESLAASAQYARDSLLPKPKTSKWLMAWRVLVAVGLLVVIIQFGIVQNNQSKILNEHSGQITQLQQTVNGNHGVSYPVIVSICEHTPGCVVPR